MFQAAIRSKYDRCKILPSNRCVIVPKERGVILLSQGFQCGQHGGTAGFGADRGIGTAHLGLHPSGMHCHGQDVFILDVDRETFHGLVESALGGAIGDVSSAGVLRNGSHCRRHHDDGRPVHAHGQAAVLGGGRLDQGEQGLGEEVGCDAVHLVGVTHHLEDKYPTKSNLTL